MSTESEHLPIWIQVCAWCGISLPVGDTAPPAAGRSSVTHGICPNCREEFIRALAAEWAAARPAKPSADETA